MFGLSLDGGVEGSGEFECASVRLPDYGQINSWGWWGSQVVCIGNESYFNRSDRTRKVPYPPPDVNYWMKGGGGGCDPSVADLRGQHDSNALLWVSRVGGLVIPFLQQHLSGSVNRGARLRLKYQTQPRRGVHIWRPRWY